MASGANTIDLPRRSVAKAVSWRLTGTIDTILVSWFVTGTVTLALSIGGLEILTKTLLYYLHERTWNRVRFGRKIVETDYQI